MKTKTVRTLLAVGTAAVVLSGCASAPIAPDVAVMPGPGKPFDQFQLDDQACRGYAQQQIGGTNADKHARDQVVSGVVAGAVIGAATGSILSGGHGHATRSGASAGAIIGGAAGADSAARGNMTLQRRYDIAYQQCMYAKGNQVPGHAPTKYVPPPRRKGS